MIFELVDYFFGLIKMILMKCIYLGHIHFHLYSKYSKNIQLRIFGKGTFRAGRDVVLRAGVKIRINNGTLIIGDDVGLNDNCLINVMDRIEIGSHTLIGQDVKMYDHDHIFNVIGNRRRTGFTKAPIVIGENVWIGSGCVILKGTVIGDRSVIGAGSVVKGEIKPDTLYYMNKSAISREIEYHE